MAEKAELKPVRELVTPEGLRWFVFDKKQTSLQEVGLEDPETGVIVTTLIANEEKRSPAYKAWGGARQSRAPGTPWEIMHEMEDKGINPDAKLEEMWNGYGHASVADMARLHLDFITPMHWNMALFNQAAVNSGQEKSTRYQSRFGRGNLHPIKNYLPSGIPTEEAERLEARYQKIGDLALQLFAQTREVLTPAFTEYYRPETADHRSALGSRVLDCARYFLPMGLGSGMSMETSARDWSRIIGEFKASPIPLYGRIAGQIEHLLSPSGEEEQELGYLAEAPGLLRHADKAPTVNDNLDSLYEIIVRGDTRLIPTNTEFPDQVQQGLTLLLNSSAGELLVAQYLSLLQPGSNLDDVLIWLRSNSELGKRALSKNIFNDQDKFKELPIWAGTTADQTVVVKSFLGEVRDFNRHRGMRRFVPMPLAFGRAWDSDITLQILAKGYGVPRYVDEVDAFKDQKQQMVDGMRRYYDEMYDFMDEITEVVGGNDLHAMLNLLPLGHQTDIWLSGDPKQWLYFTSQRVRPSGHINYRTLAYDANQAIADSDPFLSGMKFDSKRPDPADRLEFFDRS